MKPFLAAAVILYNPDNTIIDHISTYADNVDIVFAIDNSDQKKADIIERLLKNSNVYYIDNYGNKGIAHALNIGAKKAIEMGYEWLLTMDQDSLFQPEVIQNYFECWDNYPAKQLIAIFSPVHFPLKPSLHNDTCTSVPKTHVMTSGNLLNLTVFQRLQGFNEQLFIDEVDHEYCLRAHLSGYNVIEFSHISLSHNLGIPTTIYKNGQSIQSSTHSPKRFYYIIRNRLYMWRMYHNSFPEIEGIQLFNIIKTILFPLIYHDQKVLRFLHITRGILHFMVNRYGK